MNPTPFDSGIPLLTEILSPAAPPPVAPQQPASVTSSSLPPAEWRQLETEVCHRVLQQLFSNVDVFLEQRVRDSLADVLQIAVQSLAAEIRTGLQHTLEEAIAQAVTQEVARLPFFKK